MLDAHFSIGVDAERALLAVARESVGYGLRSDRNDGPMPVEPELHPEPLRRVAPSFVTLRRRSGELRGCIGELEARRSLVESVACNAWSAAFRDPRFDAVAESEWRSLEIHISILGPLERLEVGSEQALIATLRPGIDGLLLDDGHRRATFLPAVWASLPDPTRFVHELQRKAGLADGVWSAGLQASRYRVIEMSDRNLGDPDGQAGGV